jgi:hypothetical protein
MLVTGHAAEYDSLRRTIVPDLLYTDSIEVGLRVFHRAACFSEEFFIEQLAFAKKIN